MPGGTGSTASAEWQTRGRSPFGLDAAITTTAAAIVCAACELSAVERALSGGPGVSADRTDRQCSSRTQLSNGTANQCSSRIQPSSPSQRSSDNEITSTVRSQDRGQSQE